MEFHLLHAGHMCRALFPACRSLDLVPACMLPHFKEAAEQLVREKGTVEVVASALAYISGAKEIISRSLLSAQQVGWCG